MTLIIANTRKEFQTTLCGEKLRYFSLRKFEFADSNDDSFDKVSLNGMIHDDKITEINRILRDKE